MSTLLTIGDSEGERRCDARCYLARTSECSCICRGMNHGVGLAKARENTRRRARELEGRGLTPRPSDPQGDLFDPDP